MRTDFDKQWERRKAWHGRCPLDDVELRRRVQCAQTLDKNSSLITHHPSLITHHPSLTTRLWLPAAAAACLLAVLLPPGLREQPKSDVERVSVGGSSFFFVCNCDCSADETLTKLNRLAQ